MQTLEGVNIHKHFIKDRMARKMTAWNNPGCPLQLLQQMGLKQILQSANRTTLYAVRQFKWRSSICLRPFFGGVGTLFCFHSVQPAARRPSIPGYLAICNSVEFLEQLIHHLLERGVDIVSMDELAQRLAIGDRRRFAVFTFDDGFKDNLDHVLPLFRKHRLPLCLYIAPGLLDGKAVLWWHYLAKLLAQEPWLEFEWQDRIRVMPAGTLQEKNRAYDEMAELIRFSDQSQTLAFAGRLFEQYGIDWRSAPGTTLLNWQQLRELSRDKLITIGAHTLTHRTLDLLSDSEVLGEIRGSRDVLQDRLGILIKHYAYPFGGRRGAGDRVLGLGERCGFETMVTTRAANVFPQHEAHLHCLPRVSVSGNREGLAVADAMTNGLATVATSPFHRVVTS